MIWEEIKEPRGKIALKATEEINQIKQKRIEQDRSLQSELNKKKKLYDKMVEESKDEVEQRNFIYERD